MAYGFNDSKSKVEVQEKKEDISVPTGYVGSAVKALAIKYDAQGHITSTTTSDMYPPTTVGKDGQIWESDGTGTGNWVSKDTTPTSGSVNAVTSGGVYTALTEKVGKTVETWSGTNLAETTYDGVSAFLLEDIQVGDLIILSITSSYASYSGSTVQVPVFISNNYNNNIIYTYYTFGLSETAEFRLIKKDDSSAYIALYLNDSRNAVNGSIKYVARFR